MPGWTEQATTLSRVHPSTLACLAGDLPNLTLYHVPDLSLPHCTICPALSRIVALLSALLYLDTQRVM